MLQNGHICTGWQAALPTDDFRCPIQADRSPGEASGVSNIEQAGILKHVTLMKEVVPSAMRMPIAVRATVWSLKPP